MITTIQELIEAVRAEAKKRPEVYYQREAPGAPCSNTRGKCSDGSCGCIFGQVLLKDADDARRKIIEDYDNCGIFAVMEKLAIATSVPESQWCLTVQDHQDNGFLWGKCVEAADRDCPIEPDVEG